MQLYLKRFQNMAKEMGDRELKAAKEKILKHHGVSSLGFGNGFPLRRLHFSVAKNAQLPQIFDHIPLHE